MLWEDKLKDAYLNKEKSVFVLYGNTEEIFESIDKSKVELNLREYLGQKIFAKRKIVIYFNAGTGISFRDEFSKDVFIKYLSAADTLKGTKHSTTLPSSLGEILQIFNRFIRIEGPKYNMAIIIDRAELLAPQDDLNQLSSEEKKTLVMLSEWAKDRNILKNDISIVLITENLFDIHSKIVKDPYIANIEVEVTDFEDRKRTVKKYINEFNVKSELSQQSITKIINGLNRRAIRELFLSFKNSKVDTESLKEIKKRLVEKDDARFIEFVETDKTLNDFAGNKKAVQRLREDAELIKKGALDAIPMGYLLCGPVGTGKSYLAECFAGEVGIPVVQIKNFRDRWVGATESNWESVVTTLKNLAPVVVMVDEADAALGNREQSDSTGIDKRIFASLAQTMGDTKNRGKLIWMLITARPDLLPIDLKRQGRAEVHIPIFYPQDINEKIEMFRILAKKLKLDTIQSFLSGLVHKDLENINSGAEIESLLITIKRNQYLKGKPITKEEFAEILTNFRSSLDPEVVEKQIRTAMNETTDKGLLG